MFMLIICAVTVIENDTNPNPHSLTHSLTHSLLPAESCLPHPKKITGINSHKKTTVYTRCILI